MDSPAFHAYALTSSVLAIHLVLLAFFTGGVRALSKTYVNPEDKAVVKGTQADRDAVTTLRAARAHMNALENFVPFVVVGALFIATGASKSAAEIYCYTFLGARLLHSVFYLVGLQPFRTMAFAVGALTILGMGVQVIRAVI